MSPAFEAFLARLYVDAELRGRFLADSRGAAAAAGLTGPEREALAGIDRVGLALAARSFEGKREARAGVARRGWRRRWSWGSGAASS